MNEIMTKDNKINIQDLAEMNNTAMSLFEGKDEKEKAIELWKIAAKKGYAPAQYNLANCYQDGVIVKKNYKKAVKLYQLAVDQGDLYAYNNLAYCYMHGKGVKKDLKKANELLDFIELKKYLMKPIREYEGL
jgi:TPR repeat protein